MTQTLLLILFTSLWTLGVYFATYEGMVLEGVKKLGERTLGEHWNKPFLGCPFCMPSLHGAVIVFLYHAHHYPFCIHPWYWIVLQWMMVTAGSSALNHLFYTLIEMIRGYKSLFDPEEKK